MVPELDLIEMGASIGKQLPKPYAGKERLENVSDFMVGTFKGLMVGSFILKALMSTSLQSLWASLNVLQLIVHTPLLDIDLP